MQFMWMGEWGGYQILLIDTFYIDLRGPSIELLGTLFFVNSDRGGWVKGTPIVRWRWFRDFLHFLHFLSVFRFLRFWQNTGTVYIWLTCYIVFTKAGQRGGWDFVLTKMDWLHLVYILIACAIQYHRGWWACCTCK